MKAVKLTLASFVVVLGTLFSHGAIEEVDGIKWWYKTCDGGVEISSGNEYTAAIDRSTTGDISVPQRLGGQSVVAIGAGAFYECTQLSNVVIHAGVKSIGAHAFYQCVGLKTVVIPQSVDAIGYCAFQCASSLESVSLPGVKTIDNYAFQWCNRLKSISLPSIQAVGNYAFTSTALYDLLPEDSLSVVDGKVVIGWKGTCPHEVTIPNGVRAIAGGAFENARILDTVSLPEGLLSIGDAAFMGTSLMSLSLPSSLIRIESSAFANCGGITSVTLPASLLSVGSSAFSACDALTELTINSGLLFIGQYAFSDCEKIESVTIPASVTNIDYYVFMGCASLVSVTFEGNAPKHQWGLYNGTPSTLTTYVPYGSTGWSSDTSSRLPSTWCDRAIAHYGTPQTHTVTFDPQWAGANLTNIVYEDEEQVVAPNVPSRTGWSFRGWYDDPTDGEYIVWSGSTFYPAGDVTLYGHWERSGSGDDIEDNLCYAYDRKTGYTWSFLPDEDSGTASLIGVEPVPEGVLTIPSTVKDNDSDSTFTVISLGYDNHESAGCSFCGGSSSYASDFQCLDGITSLVIPSTVKSIGRESFRGCSSLATLTIPSSVTHLGSGAFAETGLKNVTIPATVTSFSLNAFDSCKQLETLTVAAKTISSACSLDLYDCPKLTTLNLPDSIDGIDPENDDWYSLCVEGLSSLASLTVPEGVTSLECWGGGPTNLAAAYLPSTLNSLLCRTFVGCWKLDKVVFAGDLLVDDGESSVVDALDVVLYFANSVYYSSAYAAHWEKILRNSGYGGTYGVYAPKQTKTMAAMVAAAPQYATEKVPDIGPFVATVSAQQTIAGAQGLEMSNVPVGLTWNSASGTLSGTAKKSGMYTVQVGGEDLTLRIDPSPDQEEEDETIEIVRGMKIDLDLGLVGYAAKNLPKGLSYNSRTGKLSGTAKTVTDLEGAVVTFTKKDAADVELTFVVRAENAPSIECTSLTNGIFTVGVAGGGRGATALPIAIDAESGIKSVTATKLPTGMKIASSKDKTSWYITGAPTKAGTYEVAITLTTAAGNKMTEKFAVTVAALPSGATGTFNGFVQKTDAGSGETLNAGSFQVTVSDVGKITAKVVAAAGTYSFTATGWDSVKEGVYSVEMTTKKGDVLSLTCDSGAAWNTHQLTGSFAAKGATALSVEAQKNAFGKQWFFNATGDDANGWTLAFAENAKAAALTVTLNADGKTSVAGKLGAYKITASGYADVSGIGTGAIFADFAPVVTVGKAKKVLSFRANLWFDKKDNHEEGVGSAVFVP